MLARTRVHGRLGPLVVALATATAVACSDSTSAPPAPLRLRLGVDSVALASGHSQALHLEVRRGNGPALTNVSVQWGSSAPAIASVDANGVVSANTAGTATVTATVDTFTTSVPVRVFQRAEALALPTSASLDFRDTVTLALTARDGAGQSTTPDSITWSSSDTLVAEVDSTGRVMAVGWGNAAITAVRGDVAAHSSLTTSVTQIATPADLVTISGTWEHMCGLTAAGVAYCNGRDGEGELGDGSLNSTGMWVAVTGGHTFANVQAGQYESCGLTTTSELYCWGSNSHGAIGQDAIDPASTQTLYFTTPTLVVGGHTWKQFSVGQHEAVCAVTTDDVPYCWGHNDIYQVGRAPLASADPKVLPPSGGLSYSAVSEGPFGGCGLTPQGATYCWGWSDLFSGAANTPNDPAPHLLPDLPALASISTGDAEGCGLTASGAAWCWGDGYGGTLGGGTFPALDSPNRWSGATAVAGGLTFAKISVGGQSDVCGLTTDGKLYCWGAHYSQKPAGTQVVPRPFGPPGVTFRDVNAGFLFTAAVTSDGRLYRW